MTFVRPLWYNISNIDSTIESIRADGGIVGIAHPFQLGTPICTGGHWDYKITKWENVSYMEIFSEGSPFMNTANKKARRLWHSLLSKGYKIAPTMGSIQQIIHDIETDNRPVSATVDDIIESVADKYDLTKSDLISEKRNANISLARNVSMYIIREVTGLSLENIGNKFGGKKHSTVKHSIDIVEERIMRDVKFKNTVYNIIKQFKDN